MIQNLCHVVKAVLRGSLKWYKSISENKTKQNLKQSNLIPKETRKKKKNNNKKKKQKYSIVYYKYSYILYYTYLYILYYIYLYTILYK